MSYLQVSFMSNFNWSTPKNGLQVYLELPKINYKAGDSITFKLHFKNVSNQNIRIYLINSEVFRTGQSTIYIIEKESKELVMLVPDPHPHGIVVDETDFHLIEPNKGIVFEQTTLLTESKFKNGGQFIVRWLYSNDIKRWPGGIMTLDGPTKKLFGGKDIPFIWIGKIEYETSFTVLKGW